MDQRRHGSRRGARGIGARMIAMVLGAGAIGGAGLIGLVGGGCASYVNYPALGADDAAVNDPNISPAPTLMEVALRHVVERFPVDGEYVINLPPGMARRRAGEVLVGMKDPDARLVSPETVGLPAYHVTRVWMRPGERGQVEVLRPVFGVGTPGDTAQYQPVWVTLRRSPISAWRVDSARAWTMGVTPPALNGWPEPGARSWGPAGAAPEEIAPSDTAPDAAPDASSDVAPEDVSPAGEAPADGMGAAPQGGTGGAGAR